MSRMSKTVDKTTSKSKRAKRAADLFKILRDLQPGERFAEPPAVFAGGFRFSRQAACRTLRRYGVLREGSLLIYANQKHAESNRLWRSVDLAKCTIAYRVRDRKILVELTERYRLKVGKSAFPQWVENFRVHRLYAQTKAAGVQEAARAAEPPIELAVICSPAPAAVSPTVPETIVENEQESTPVAQMAPSGEMKARIPLPVTVIVPSQTQQESLKKASVQLQPMIVQGNVQKQGVPLSSKNAQVTNRGPKQPKLEKDQRTIKAPIALSVEVFMRESEPTQGGKGRLVPLPVPVPLLPSTSGSPTTDTFTQAPAKEPLVKDVVVTKEPNAQPITEEPTKRAVKAVFARTAPMSAPAPVKKKQTEEPPSRAPDEQESIVNSVDSGSDVSATPTGGMSQRHGFVRSVKPPLRSRLPAPMNPSPSLFRLIMSAVGRDIMRIALPASVMEPLSTLQVLCEEFEHADLIDQALTQSDPQWRMLYVAAFAMSRYGSTAKRAGRKPFNPLLAETYEFVHPTAGWRFLAEQVSHHPPVSAYFAEGKGWRSWHDCELIASLSMSAVKATPVGTLYLQLDRLGETYVWNKVTSQVTGILSGVYTIDHLGEMVISCQQTRLKCKLNFKVMGAGRRGDVEGQLLDEKGKVLRRVYGNWTERFFVGTPDDPNSTRIWRLADLPPDYERYYGLSRFALGLNEIRPDVHGVLPRTDTRYRPDQRALEMGKVDEAEKVKRGLEEKQRQRKKVNDAEKKSHTPLWFRATGVTNASNGPRWQYTDKYWRAKKDQFKGVQFVDLW